MPTCFFLFGNITRQVLGHNFSRKFPREAPGSLTTAWCFPTPSEMWPQYEKFYSRGVTSKVHFLRNCGPWASDLFAFYYDTWNSASLLPFATCQHYFRHLNETTSLADVRTLWMFSDLQKGLAREGLRVVGPKATCIPAGPGLQWSPGRCPGRGSGVQKLKHFVNLYTNFDVLENEYTKTDLSCIAMPITGCGVAQALC